MIALDAAWRAAHPLPTIAGEVSKNSRGRVLAIGGAAGVPGALRLTGEAALRVGAGKVRLAVPAGLATPLGIAFPEAGVLPLAERDGEIAAGANDDRLRAATAGSDAVVLGPGMGDRDAAAALVVAVARAPCAAETMLVLDAAAVACAGPLCAALAGYGDRLVLTPHPGEMAALTGVDAAAVAERRAELAQDVARRFRAVVAMKGTDTLVAAPDGTLLHYPGGGPGLATGGSGDVLAGIIAGLLARGASPLLATGWGVWLHGTAGRALAARHGPIGFLGRELLPELPRLLPR